MIGLQDESVEGNSNIICTSCDSRNSKGGHSRIGTSGVNKEVFSPRSNTTSNVLSCTDNIKKFNTLVHGSTTQKGIWNRGALKKWVWKLSSLNYEMSLTLEYG